MEIYKGEKYYPVYQEPSSDVSAVAFGILRLSDGYWYDFNDGTFKASGWTNQYQTMTEDSNGLWIYTSGWTTPSTVAQYRIQYKVTDPGGAFYVGGEQINVTSVQPLVYTQPTTAVTAAEMLTQVESAIVALINKGAKQYAIGNRNFTANDLGELRAWRKELKIEISAASGRARTYASFANPT